jgi:hypothetical protein
MKKEGDAEMRDEYDFSRAVRGRHAGRLTVRERGELLQRSAVQDVQAWISNTLIEVQRLEAALFSYFVLTRHQLPQQAGALAASLLNDDGVVTALSIAGLRVLSSPAGEFEASFGRVIAERAWLVHRSGFECQHARSDQEKTDALLARLERIMDDASAVKAQLEEAVQDYLSRTGLSKEEIDEKTDETKELWLAA